MQMDIIMTLQNTIRWRAHGFTTEGVQGPGNFQGSGL